MLTVDLHCMYCSLIRLDNREITGNEKHLRNYFKQSYRLTAPETSTRCRRLDPPCRPVPREVTQTRCPLTSSTLPWGSRPRGSVSPCLPWEANTPGLSYRAGKTLTNVCWLEMHIVIGRVTNGDGRASNFLSWEDFKPGTYKMHFATGQYFKEKNTETFYPFAEVSFQFCNLI